jgi:hypothetical protein
MPTTIEFPLATIEQEAGELFVAGGLKPVVDAITEIVEAMPLDISSDAGRTQVRSVCRKIGSSQKVITEAKQSLTRERKAALAAIDAEGKWAVDSLETLKKRISAPLAEWESRDQKRIDAHEAAITAMGELQMFDDMPSTLAVASRIEELKVFEARDWDEFAMKAGKVHKTVTHWLGEKMKAAQKHEAEQAELVRLREEAAAREREEREERIRRDAEAKQRAEWEAKAKREQEAREAAERARREREDRDRRLSEQREALLKQEAEDAKLQAIIAEERRVKALADAAREADRRAAEATKAEIDRAARQRAKEQAEEKKRVADKQHRDAIRAEVMADLGEHPLMPKLCPEEWASLLDWISDGHIRHLKIDYSGTPEDVPPF